MCSYFALGSQRATQSSTIGIIVKPTVNLRVFDSEALELKQLLLDRDRLESTHSVPDDTSHQGDL
jgi:hypothetical protein